MKSFSFRIISANAVSLETLYDNLIEPKGAGVAEGGSSGCL